MLLEDSLVASAISYTYYTFQHRCIQLTPHNEPDGRMYTVEEALTSEDSEIRRLGKGLKDYNWSSPSWNSFGCGLKSDICKGNDVRSNPEPYEVWCKIGKEGYWSLKYAKQALSWLRERNENGGMDRKHQGSVYQRARYEFRIVKVVHVPDVWEIV